MITEEQIMTKANFVANNSRFINGTHRTGFIYGFKEGAEWMEEQLEPLITELGMFKARSPKWIPVTERMPEVNKPVLVALKGRITGKDMFKVDEYIDKEWRYTTSGFITHWMPLPEPHKQD